MIIIRDITNLHLKDTIVTLGKFDGNHLGHRLLFDTVVKLKKAHQKAVIFTFQIHPEKVLGTELPDARTISSDGEREEEPYPEGIDYLIEFPFNQTTRNMEPEEFVRDVLTARLGISTIVCGEDFRFGRNRAGDVRMLEELGRKYGFSVVVLPKLTIRLDAQGQQQDISSTLIKQEIRRGNMEDVRIMLGKPFRVTGKVLHGKHLGSTIGFPTLNMTVPEDKILPPDGVYATRTFIGGREYMSITNVGCRPTFDDGEQRNVETHLFDFDRDVYGETALVDFYRFIRPERRFEGPQELQQEIERNKEQVKQYFTRNFT